MTGNGMKMGCERLRNPEAWCFTGKVVFCIDRTQRRIYTVQYITEIYSNGYSQSAEVEQQLVKIGVLLVSTDMMLCLW